MEDYGSVLKLWCMCVSVQVRSCVCVCVGAHVRVCGERGRGSMKRVVGSVV